MDASRPWRLEGVVKPYAWGSRTAIPELLGRAPGAEPQAELWLGAHPQGAARVLGPDGRATALDDWIRRDPEGVLGRETARRFEGELPFLLKVLAAEAPLSLQAHPSRDQARVGFARENEAGIPLDAPERCYRDPHPKPELICALTDFHALNRFRDPAEMAARLGELDAPALEPFAAALRKSGGREALMKLFAALWRLDADARAEVLARATGQAELRGAGDAAWRWVGELAARHPGDIGALAPLLLNVVTLAPGQAMFLPAGELHSYLGGVGIEIMASSDNVLRGGLTPKHVDTGELLRTLSFRSGEVEVLAPRPEGAAEAFYDTPAEEFALSCIGLDSGGRHEVAARRGVEILLCTAGSGRLECGGETCALARGEALLVPAAAPAWRVEGELTLYRAGVGRAR